MERLTVAGSVGWHAGIHVSRAVARPGRSTHAPTSSRSESPSTNARPADPRSMRGTPLEVAMRVMTDTPPPPSELNPAVPPALDAIIARAMAKDAAARYESARSLHADLLELKHAARRIDGRGPPSTAPSTTNVAPQRPSDSRRWSPRAPWPRWWRRGSRRVCCGAGGTCRRPRPSCGTTAAPAPFARGRIFRRARRWSARSRSTTRSRWRGRGGRKPTRRWDSPTGPGRNCCRPWRCSRIARRCRPPSRTMWTRSRRRSAATSRRRLKSTRSSRIRLADAEKSAAYVDLGRAYEKNEDLDRAIDSYVKATQLDPQSAAAFLRSGILYGRRQQLPTGERRILEGGGHLPGDVEPGRPGRGALPAGIAAGQDQETA